MQRKGESGARGGGLRGRTGERGQQRAAADKAESSSGRSSTKEGETGAREAELSGQKSTASKGDGQKVWAETEKGDRDPSAAAVERGREGNGSGKATSK